jgi:hypothetical protein
MYLILIVQLSLIPNNVYIYPPLNGTLNEWKYINKCVFNNGLEYYIGSNEKITDYNVFIEYIKFEYFSLLDCEYPEDFQNLLYYKYNMYLEYKHCLTIWNYHLYNKDKIIEILKKHVF